MLFNTPDYFIFLTFILLGIEIVRNRDYQQFILLCASYFFYWYTSSYTILFLVFVTLITWYTGARIHESQNLHVRRIWLIFSLVCCLGLLGYFKYYNFAVQTVGAIINQDIPLTKVILPIGISFYTFQGLSYVFDIYKGTYQPTNSFWRFALFKSYFPQLVAGPITRASELMPQLSVSLKITADNLQYGISRILWGLFKKVVIADNISPIVNAIFIDPVGRSSAEIILGTFLFGIQIYCDFSGYCDIALGSARIMGIKLPENFHLPYLSKNPTEFWRRWHMTLGKYIRDYLYIPLGGNRKGRIRTEVNLLFSMMICGLWHGASWNFVLWGGYHGVLLAVDKLIQNKLKKIEFFAEERWSLLISILMTTLTLYFVFLGWLLFRVTNTEHMVYCLTKFIFLDLKFSSYQIWVMVLCLIGYFALILILHIPKVRISMSQFNKVDLFIWLGDLPLHWWALYVIVLMQIIIWLSPSDMPQFIYFEF